MTPAPRARFSMPLTYDPGVEMLLFPDGQGIRLEGPYLAEDDEPEDEEIHERLATAWNEYARLRAVAVEARKVSEKFMRDIDAVNRMIDYKPGELPMKRDQGLEALNAALEGLK